MSETARGCVAVILAGGRGERLGGVFKGGLRLGGKTLLERAQATLALQADTILIACASEPPLACPTVPVVLDPQNGPRGPAGGLAAACQWCRDRGNPGPLLSVAVDTPFFPSNFTRRALPLLAATAGVVVASYAGRRYPTNALWDLDALSHALAGAAHAPKGPALMALEEMAGDVALDYEQFTDRDPFANINTLQDLLTCTRILENQRT